MATRMAWGISPSQAGTLPLSATRGPMCPMRGTVVYRARLVTDPTGTFTLRLKNLVVGSRVRVEVQTTGALVDEFIVSSADQDRSINLYASGNANNNLRIKVRKASAAPKYQSFETYAQAQQGTVTAYIAQVSDPIA